MPIRLFFFLSLALNFTLPLKVAAETPIKGKREVNLELEEVEGATLYEIELTSKNSEKKQLFKMQNPAWRAAIRPGEYILRLRSYDRRKVPGPWSDPNPFVVKLPGPDLYSPKSNALIKTKEEETFKVEFKWQKVSYAKKYRLDIHPEDGSAAISETFKEPSGEVKLPVAKKYSWKVTPISEHDEEGEAQDQPGTFTLVGKQLENPEIAKPEDPWVEAVHWHKPEYAESFSFLLQYKTKANKWKTIQKKSNQTTESLTIPTKYPGGEYRLAVKAQSPLRDPSPVAKMQFKVAGGDRSPAAVEEAKLRYSLEKPTPWYMIASYFITQIQYAGENPEGGDRVSYPALGGTGRLGLGYIHPEKNRGYLGIVDLSGFTVDNKNVTYASAEGHYVKRYTWGPNMIRPSGGLFYKELSEIKDKNTQTGVYRHEKLTFLGPHVGFDFWHPFSPKFGFQLNARVYYGLLGLTTPGGRSQLPELSYQIGLMGSYKLRPNLTGFVGWAHKLEAGSYEATPDDGSHLISVAPAGSIQRIKVEGDYLNLLLEWGF